MSILSIQNVSKSFGTQQVLNNIQLEVTEGKIVGLLGKNGAGKTTLMKMILGLLPITDGEIYVHDEKVQFGNSPTNRFVGYLPDVPSFYPYLSAFEYLMLCTELAGLPKKIGKERSHHFLKLVGLEKEKKRISAFSRGMKQRLGIAQALIHQPSLLICDEPTSALDPSGRQEVIQILNEVKKETTILLSTHILNDAQQICDEVAMLHEGKLALQGDVDQLLLNNQKQMIEVRFATKEAAEHLRNIWQPSDLIMEEIDRRAHV